MYLLAFFFFVGKLNLASKTACGIFYALQLVHCTWLYTRNYRTKLRALFKLPETPYGDTMVHCCCCVCALTQEYRELQNRGVDPSIGNLSPFSFFFFLKKFINEKEERDEKKLGLMWCAGWEGNVMKWKREGVVVPPLFPSEMAR